MARACDIYCPLSVDLATAHSCCAEAKAAYLACKPDAEDMLLASLSENEDIPIRDREEEAEKIIQQMIKKEESRAIWRHINATYGIQQMESVREVVGHKDGIDLWHTTQEEVEHYIIDAASQLFCLTEKWSPFRTGPLAKIIGLLGDSEAADKIL
eukprot:8210960-Ditylum_brightwellii.AAC.1